MLFPRLSLFVFSLILLMPHSLCAQTGVGAMLNPGYETSVSPAMPSGQGTGLYGQGDGSASDPSNTRLGAAPADSALAAPMPLYVPGNIRGAQPTFFSRPAWAQLPQTVTSNYFPPFGANLFQGYFAGTYYEGANGNYAVMPGDRILVHIWGAHAFNDVVMVDQQGNIFLPEVGPVPVVGLNQNGLQSTVRNYLSHVFRDSVEVYVNLLTAQPVAVYVTGFVQRPGRFAGGGSDTVLYYLDKAGGILPDRGSYRDITIKRGGKVVATVDLYSFILTGTMNGGTLRDGDVIVVGPKKGSVQASGLIPQQASYESRGQGLTGADLTAMAAPLPSASHVSVVGTRLEAPFHVYLPLSEFAEFKLAPHDLVEFLADTPSETIMVSVSGSVLGATRYPVKRTTTMHSLLAHVPVDPELSNLSGIYLKRRSVVEHEKKAISDALQRLERAVLTAPSFNQETAAIRVQEAQLVQQFVARVSALTPDGVVVVTKNGQTADIILEDGDEIIIPQKSDVVQITGEIAVPKAVVHVPGQSASTYVKGAGGYTQRADQNNILVVHPNGEIVAAVDTEILAGDLLMVMPKYETKGFSLFKDIVQILYQVALATKVVLDL